MDAMHRQRVPRDCRNGSVISRLAYFVPLDADIVCMFNNAQVKVLLVKRGSDAAVLEMRF
jgi:hypothetical protein